MSHELSRRTLLKAGVAAGGAAFLSACAGPTPNAPTGPTTLRFMSNHATTEEAVFRTAADLYTSQNPNVKIEYLNIADLASYQTKVKTLAVTDDLPDIFFTRTAEVAAQGAQNWNLDLTEYAEKNADVSDIWPAMVKQMTYEDQLLALPYDFSNQGIYYNKTMFEAEGIPLPTGDDLTWEELFQIAEAFKKVENGQQTRWGITLRYDEWCWWGILDAFGGGLLNEDQSQCTAALPENVAALESFIELYPKGISPLTSSLPTGVDPFAAGLVALQMNGSWSTQSRRDNIGDSFEWDVVKLPKGPTGNRSIAPNGGSWTVNSTTQNAEHAQAFCTFLAAPEQLRTFIAEPMRGIPGRQSVAAEWEQIVADAELPPANMAIFPEQLEEALEISYPTYWQELITSWTNRVKTLSAPGDVKAALQGVQDDVNRAIF